MHMRLQRLSPCVRACTSWGVCSILCRASEHAHCGGACLAVGAAKVDVGQVLWEPSIVEEDTGLHNLLRQDARHAQHGPPPVLQLCLSVPALARPPPKTLPCESVDGPSRIESSNASGIA